MLLTLVIICMGVIFKICGEILSIEGNRVRFARKYYGGFLFSISTNILSLDNTEYMYFRIV